MDKDGTRPEGTEHSTHSEKPMLQSGDHFGNYRVVDCICDGLIIKYYHMQHIRDLRDVTVGVLHPKTTSDREFAKRLQALQKVTNGLDHEGIPKIHDITVIDGCTCLFMDPIEGHNLSHYFAENAAPGEQGVNPESVMRILAQILGVLGYAHTQGLDHRDIESDMVILQKDGSVCLLGIGLRAALGKKLFEAIISASVSPFASEKDLLRLNSFDTMSPEFKAGIEEDERADLFALGVLGYWLLTARLPDERNPEMPSSLIKGIIPGTDDFFTGLLQRKREDRIQSCKMALLALKKAHDHGEPDAESSNTLLIQRQIDRMPVPKSVVARGELATRIYRLSLIGLVAITLVALASFFLIVSFTEEETYTKNVAGLVADGQTPNLVVEVQPPVAEISFSRLDESFITNNGRLELRVSPGVYKLRATAPNHGEMIEPVEVKPGEEVPALKVPFKLPPLWTDVQLETEPAASVSIVDAQGLEVKLGDADEKGKFMLEDRLLQGDLQLVVRKQGFVPSVLKDGDFEIGEAATLEVPLDALPASLLVRTDPAGARVTINGIDVGVSPLIVDDLKPGERYRVVARRDQYRPVRRNVAVETGEDVVLDMGTLTPKSAELQVELNFEGLDAVESKSLRQQTSILLGDQRLPVDAPELRDLPEGRYQVRVEHPNYAADPVELKLVDRDIKKLDFTLSPLPGQVRLILPEDFEPSVSFNGKEIQLQGKTISIPAFREVEFELRAENYYTMTRRVKLDPKERIVWEVEPVLIPGPTLGQDWAMPYLGFQLSWVPAGAFEMGSPLREQGRLPNEGPTTKVSFSRGFWVGAYEVTQAAFRKIMNRSPAQFVGAKRPVDSITWEDANAFLERLNATERKAGRLPPGYIYRLPTEAEWEYAARAGSDTPFHFGEEADASMGNFRGVYPREREGGVRETASYGTQPVGSYSPNAFGIYDIHGNVSEWTIDAYNARLPGDKLTNPAPRVGGRSYALRGGSWEDFAVRVRTTARSEAPADTVRHTIGFRIFLAPER